MVTGMLAAAQRAARFAGAAFLDCFLPQFCGLCRRRTLSNQRLCADCAGLLRPRPFAYCPLCRFENERADPVGWRLGSECPVHGGVSGLASLRIEEPVLQLVHRFKYSGEKGLARTLADLMPDPGAYEEGTRPYNLMCPVPLFRTRLRERGFNQSAELGAQLEPRLGVPLIVDLLAKRAPTPEQARLAGRARRRNLLGCFAVARPAVVHHKNVILVDDVVTTGSTASACIEALMAAGAVRVVLLTVAA
jgi:ComF family protein